MMRWKYIKLVGNVSAIVFLLSACQSDYTKLVKRELAKGVRYDSILLGIRFGDSEKNFRDKCFELNRQHVVTEGQGFWVQYLRQDTSMHSMKLLFLPTFDNKQIMAGLNLRLSYGGWSPTGVQPGSLKREAMKLLMHWYGGNEFITAHTKEGDMPVKLDGNRRILIYENPPMEVVVKIQDILHPMFNHFPSDKERISTSKQ